MCRTQNGTKNRNLRYQRVLRDPARSLVEALRDNYIERLSPEVAGGKRHLSILKKNDYGKGGYHDHYWFAFYDPSAGSKTKSVQLYFRMIGSEQVWRYGFAMGNYCDEYVERLRSASPVKSRYGGRIHSESSTRRQACDCGPTKTESKMTPNDFAELLASHAVRMARREWQIDKHQHCPRVPARFVARS